MYKAYIYPLSNLLWTWSTSCENTFTPLRAIEESWWKGKGRRRDVALLLARSGHLWWTQPPTPKKNAGRDCISSKNTNDLRSLIYPVLFYNASFIFQFIELFIYHYTLSHFAQLQLIKHWYRWKYIHLLNHFISKNI